MLHSLHGRIKSTLSGNHHHSQRQQAPLISSISKSPINITHIYDLPSVKIRSK